MYLCRARSQNENFTLYTPQIMMYISSQATIWKAWRPAAHMVDICGKPFIDGCKAMEGRGQVLTVSGFRKTAGMMPHDIMRIASYMESSYSSVPGINTLCVKFKKQAFWEWHLLHPQNDMVHPSRSMFFHSLFFTYACPCATTVSSMVPYLYIPHRLQRHFPKLRD
jgi:hypothetical protein